MSFSTGLPSLYPGYEPANPPAHLIIKIYQIQSTKSRKKCVADDFGVSMEIRAESVVRPGRLLQSHFHSRVSHLRRLRQGGQQRSARRHDSAVLARPDDRCLTVAARSRRFSCTPVVFSSSPRPGRPCRCVRNQCRVGCVIAGRFLAGLDDERHLRQGRALGAEPGDVAFEQVETKTVFAGFQRGFDDDVERNGLAGRQSLGGQARGREDRLVGSGRGFGGEADQGDILVQIVGGQGMGRAVGHRDAQVDR